MSFLDYNAGPPKNSPHLLDQIQNKLGELSQDQWDSLRFGVNTAPDLGTVEDLYILRDILLQKLNCNSCLRKFPLEMIRSKILSIINKRCLNG